MSDADKPAELPQLKEMAKRMSDDVDTAFDYMELCAMVLAPLYAELEKKDAAIVRKDDLLRTAGSFLRATDWSSEESKRQCLGKLLDGIDAETGGGDGT